MSPIVKPIYITLQELSPILVPLFQVLDPILSGHEIPPPLHLAETGRIRWRPIGNNYQWSEHTHYPTYSHKNIGLGS